jgi:hypothetical protein
VIGSKVYSNSSIGQPKGTAFHQNYTDGRVFILLLVYVIN